MRPLMKPPGSYWGPLGVLLGSHSSAPACAADRLDDFLDDYSTVSQGQAIEFDAVPPTGLRSAE